MTEIDYEKFKEIIKFSFSIHKIPSERCSQVLISQLAFMPDYGGMNSPYQFVEKEIIHLEGLGKSETKPAKPFSPNGPLKNFMHKHFWVPGYDHLGMNAMLAWKMENPNSEKLKNMARRVMKPYVGSESLEEKWKLAGEIANEFVNGEKGLMDRLNNSKATGDWLIFVNHEGVNYYLCLAKHNEDAFILNALESCVIDFPFIKGMLNNVQLNSK